MRRAGRSRRHAGTGWVGLLGIALLLVLASCAGRETSHGDLSPHEGVAVAGPVADQGATASGDVESSGARKGSTTSVDEPRAWSGTAYAGLPAAPRAARVTGNPGDSSRGDAVVTASVAPTVEAILKDGLNLARASPVHLAVRGTAGADTARCAWRGIARTAAQRADAIRFWLRLDENEAIPRAAYLEVLFTALLNSFNPEYRETAKANFLAIARGGLSEEYLFLTCFADYTVTSYLLGTGTTPGTVTVAYDRRGEARSYELYRREHEAGTFGTDALQTRGDYEASLQELVVGAEELLAAELGGQERIVFLAPMGAHNAIAFEAWQAVAHWDVETVDGTVNAVRVGAPAGDPEHTQTLANLTSRITTAAASDAHATSRVANVSGLQQKYRDMGAYGDITPGDGETTTFTPAQPPAAPTCTNGTAVTTPNDNRGLVQDCEALLAAKDGLRGTATLDWGTSTAVSGWEGITTSGTPSRVTELDLASESLTGSIPAGLGRLFELTTLDLSNNQLTGDIPAELGWLTNLTELRLSGNTLTGCIPLALKSVATNDLSSLNLLYCEPPAPTNLSAGTPGEASVALNWDAVTGAGTYRVEVRTGDPDAWTTDSDTIATTTHTVDELQCETSYELRVSAYGSGTTYAMAWGEPSAVLTTSTGTCTPPVFGPVPAMSVSEHAAVGTAVGTVTATDAEGSTVTYAITEGDDDGQFAIDAATGAITVAGALDYETTASYSLTVAASDAAGSTATATVTITVTDIVADYDTDDDGLIAVTTLAQLDAIRLDLDGDGASTDTGYAAAFPDAATGMGCPAAGCTGYELMADLDFDTDGSGAVGVDDAYWNDGSGWEPIGTSAAKFTATFDGNGEEIANLTIARDSTERVGLFGTSSGVVRRVGLTNVDVTGGNYVGGLVGRNEGSITASYVTGAVEGTGIDAGGLVGWNAGTITASYATATVTGGGLDAGGLVGGNGAQAQITASYASGTVTGTKRVGGLAGFSAGRVTASYSSGAVTGTGTPTGGLVAMNVGRVTASYWDTTTSGQPTSGGGTGKTTSELQTPSGYSDTIYADWNVNIDGVSGNDDPWHFGTSSQYPVLKVDFNGDGTATWEEFGDQHPNSPPVFADGETTTRAVDENTAAGEDIGTPVAATDADGDTLTYAPGGTDAAHFALDTATGQLQTREALDYETQTTYQVTLEVSDGEGGSASITVTIEVGDLVDTPPAPANLAVGTLGETSVALSWDAVTGAAKYRVEYRVTGTDTETDAETVTWTTDDETLTTTTHTVDELTCGTAHAFQVSSYGDGTTHTAEWSAPTTPVPAVTTACVPVFGDEPYAFGVAEDAVVGTEFGAVAATVGSEEAIVHSITAGNVGAAFALDEGSGALTLAAALDAATVASYSLTVQASVGSGDDVRTATTTVTLTVQGAPPAPANLAAGPAAQTSVPLSWDAVPGAAKYRVEYRETDTETEETETETVTWITDDETLTSTMHTVDELTCGTDFEFQVTAFGDQVVHTAAWGTPATAVPATTTACPPAFSDPPYAFPVSESAAIDDEVGVVLATDADGAEVVHAISAGSEAGAFAIDETTGALTVAATLDYLTTDAYELTVSATSTAGTTEVTVAITVTGVDCANGTVIADPRDHAELVGDCRLLLAAQTGLEGDPDPDSEDAGTLNWSEASALSTWEGVTTAGTPSRVTGLDLSDKSLGGEVPSGLGSLTALTTLDLSSNQLTGAVPSELSGLTNLTTLSLSGNSFSGCLPADLRPLAAAIDAIDGAQDLAQVSLAYCDATALSAPANLTARSGTDGVALSWDAVAGATKYRVEYRVSGTDSWTTDDATLTTTAHTVDGLTCGAAYQFQVSAYGDGFVSLAEWGAASASASASSALVVVDAALTKVSANRLRISWAYGGNCAGIAPVWHYLKHKQDYADGTRASGEGQSSAGSPREFDVYLQHVTTRSPLVRFSWTQLQVRLGGSTKRLTYVLDPPLSVAFNHAPVFGAASYAFSVAENAAENDAVGSVGATDPNADDTVTYAITAGNTGSAFAIDAGSGAITVAAALDAETTASYSLTVQADDGNSGQTSVTVTVTVTQVVENLPAAPGNLTAGTVTAASVPLSWDAVTGAAKYRVEYRLGDPDAWTVDDEALTGTSHTVGELSCGTSYEFRVSAYGDGTTAAAVWGTASDVQTASTSLCPPAAPTNLTAGTVTGTSVPLSWDAVTGAAKYRVEYRQGDPDAWTVDDEALTGTSHTVDALSCGTSYEFRVTAYGDGTTNEAAWGAASAVQTASTGACPLEAPPAPGNLTAGTVTETSVPLSWDAVTDAAKYRVEYREGEPDGWTLDDEAITGTSHTVDALSCGTAYEFRVSAYGDGTTAAAVWGTASDVQTASTSACPPPPAPTNLTAVVNADGHIVLSWNAPDDDSITGYQILRRRPTEGEDTLLVYVEDTGDTTTTYTDTNVTAGVRHVYRVKAINAGGLSEWSNYVNPTP